MLDEPGGVVDELDWVLGTVVTLTTPPPESPPTVPPLVSVPLLASSVATI